ncbi:MAG: hypothetical protein GX781_05745, partial [Clostridiales bacterium]|nr:hypothetical protein [Clostridiales bacterium]
ALLIDSSISIFGSFNFDIRSAHINTEVMLVVYSEELNGMLEEYMEGMFDLSARVYLSAEDEAQGQDNLKPISLIKNLKIHLLSPFVRMIRFLI